LQQLEERHCSERVGRAATAADARTSKGGIDIGVEYSATPTTTTPCSIVIVVLVGHCCAQILRLLGSIIALASCHVKQSRTEISIHTRQASQLFQWRQEVYV
jgi:hypothetical protein